MIIGNCFIGLFAMPVMWITHGIGLTFMWRWFIVPLGVPQIATAHALGLTILIGYLRPLDFSKMEVKIPEEMRSASVLVACIVRLVVSLLMGYTVCQFM